MKFSKKSLHLALLISMFNAVKADDIQEEVATQEFAAQEFAIVETNQEETHKDVALCIENNKEVSLQDATDLIKNFAETITAGDHFAFNHVTCSVEETLTRLTTEQLDIISTIIAQVTNSAINAISEEIQEAQQHALSKDDALALLQALEKSLVVGSVFAINGVTYTVVASH